MSQDQFPKRHHYMPEFYLKRWTSGKGTLVQFSKPHGSRVKALRVYPKQTGFMDRLYKMQGVPKERSHSFETAFFRPVDSMAATVLAKLEGRQFSLSDRERSAWSDFIMSLILRHPEQVSGIRRKMSDDLARTPRKLRARFVLSGDKPVDTERALTELSTEEGIARVALSTLTRTIRGTRTGEAIINLQWGLIHAPVISTVLTSDRPILWMGTLYT